MKRSLNLFFIFYCLTAFASPNYTLNLIENSHFKDWTPEELLAEITVNSELIKKNICNGQEAELFSPPLKINKNEDSLKIQSASDSIIYTYKDESLFLPNGEPIPLSSVEDSYVKNILGLLSTIRTVTEGRLLIEGLQKALYPVVIYKGSYPRFEAIGSNGKNNHGLDEASALQHFITLRRTVQMPLSQFGSGGRIHFNPAVKLTSLESDDKERTIAPHITLAHEMYHAYDGVRGLLDTRFVIHNKMEAIQATEYRATFFENTLRKQLGLKFRKYYGKNANKDQSLLDSAGLPYKIPAPCLKP